jgi:predicted peroxiredoxin
MRRGLTIAVQLFWRTIMSSYTFVLSRDPVDGDHLPHTLATNLAKEGNAVSLFLVENGTFLARNGVCPGVLDDLHKAGVTVWADALSLDERGITGDAIDGRVERTALETLVDHLEAGRKVSWH